MSCDDDTGLANSTEFNFSFDNNREGWEGDFADYPSGEEQFYELDFQHSSLPDPLNIPRTGALMQTGSNRSDDLFMFIYRRFNGLKRNQAYTVSFEVEFATDVADGMVGIGGSPGESVYIKAGAVSVLPEKVNQDNFYLMNIDKGNQSVGGSDMRVIGDFSNDSDQNEYRFKSISAESLLTVTSNSSGELWMIVGTDSGFEGVTTIYYNRIDIRLAEVE